MSVWVAVRTELVVELDEVVVLVPVITTVELLLELEPVVDPVLETVEELPLTVDELPLVDEPVPVLEVVLAVRVEVEPLVTELVELCVEDDVVDEKPAKNAGISNCVMSAYRLRYPLTPPQDCKTSPGHE